MEFQAVDDRLALVQDRFILFGVTLSQFLGKNIAHVAAKEFPFFAQTAAIDEGLIDRNVPPVTILDKENDFGNMIEKLFNHD